MSVFYQDPAVQLLHGDVLAMLRTLPDNYVQTIVTSPPYWGLRNYQVIGQIGMELTLQAYLDKLVAVFQEVRRVLRKGGTLWLNMGDAYASGKGTCFNPGGGKNSLSRHKGLKEKQAYPTNRGTISTLKQQGLKPKDRIGLPHRLVFALQEAGWWWRDEIIWHKRNPMPGSQQDRCTVAHEFLFMLTKSKQYFYDQEAIKEPAEYFEEAKYDPGTNGLGGGDRKTGATTRRFAKPPVGWNQGPTQDDLIGRYKAFTDSWKGSAPGRKDGPGQDRRQKRDLGKKMANADPNLVKSANGQKMGRGAGWRNDPEAFVLKRIKRSVWTINTEPFAEAHFATFPTKLVEPCILAGSRAGDVVLDCFGGSGTVGVVAKALGRRAVLIELSRDYCALAVRRIAGCPFALPL